MFGVIMPLCNKILLFNYGKSKSGKKYSIRKAKQFCHFQYPPAMCYFLALTIGKR